MLVSLCLWMLTVSMLKVTRRAKATEASKKVPKVTKAKEGSKRAKEAREMVARATKAKAREEARTKARVARATGPPCVDGVTSLATSRGIAISTRPTCKAMRRVPGRCRPVRQQCPKPAQAQLRPPQPVHFRLSKPRQVAFQSH